MRAIVWRSSLVGALLERLERLAVLVGDVLEVVDVRHVRSLL
jgi:hypothetical protein